MKEPVSVYLLKDHSQLAIDIVIVNTICKAIRRFAKTLSSTTYQTMNVRHSSGRDDI